ncbi:MAG: hypothetical protein J0H54_06180 [Rhizobiales bacterium]|nr:hypothetical protein [Hyphomicrobiales bacterium]
MRSMLLAAAVSVALSTTALAGADLSGLPSALLGGAAAEGTEHNLPQPPIGAITVGALSITLGTTTLDEVVAVLGGTISTAADGPAKAAWLCYEQKLRGQTSFFWFVANDAGAEGKVNLVGANFQLGETPTQQCQAPKEDLSALDFSVPGLGASEAQLQSRFGMVDARNGMVAYSNQKGTTIETVNYLIRDGVVAGIGATVIGAQ